MTEARPRKRTHCTTLYKILRKHKLVWNNRKEESSCLGMCRQEVGRSDRKVERWVEKITSGHTRKLVGVTETHHHD